MINPSLPKSVQEKPLLMISKDFLCQSEFCGLSNHILRGRLGIGR